MEHALNLHGRNRLFSTVTSIAEVRDGARWNYGVIHLSTNTTFLILFHRSTFFCPFVGTNTFFVLW